MTYSVNSIVHITTRVFLNLKLTKSISRSTSHLLPITISCSLCLDLPFINRDSCPNKSIKTENSGTEKIIKAIHNDMSGEKIKSSNKLLLSPLPLYE